MTTRPTSTQTTAAAPKKPRLAVRSRASMTIESRASGPSVVTHGRISRARCCISDAISGKPGRSGRMANDATGSASRRVGRMPYPVRAVGGRQRATLDGQISRNAHQVQDR